MVMAPTYSGDVKVFGSSVVTVLLPSNSLTQDLEGVPMDALARP